MADFGLLDGPVAQSLIQGLMEGLSHGWANASGWTMVLYTLVVTHLTIIGVTLYLHRSQSHRAVDFHPVVSHFLRFWLWLSTGMVTKEFVGVHRKHHAKCETDEDPHSPQTRGLKALLLTGVELYREEAKNPETLAKYGVGTPDDWMERHVYTGHSKLGIVLMLIINVVLFGAIGLTIWAIQMAWIPVWATGIINGVGHYFGYRNFEVADASTNVVPWAFFIGGEELHNNHHTYPTSAKFSVRPYEFDVGWLYISLLAKIGWATPRKTPPKLAIGKARALADTHTLQALIANRYEVMAGYAVEMRRAVAAEMEHLRSQGEAGTARWRNLSVVRKWLPRDEDKIPSQLRPHLAQALGESPKLAKLVAMREELRGFWTRTNVSAEQLVADLQQWCHHAEESGIAALHDFSLRLRSTVHAA